MAVTGAVDRVTLDQLAEYPTPAPTDTWFPIGHSRVMDMVLSTLDMMRFQVKGMDLAISHGGGNEPGARFFATLDLATDITDGVTLAVGVRNSVDRSFALSFFAGSRVMICSNLCYSAEISVVRKHTANAEDAFHGGVIKACKQLRQYQTLSAERMELLKSRSLAEEQADSLLLRAYEKDLIGMRMLRPLLTEWRQPSYEAFAPRTAFSLLNCYTHVMKPRFEALPYQAAAETMAFQQFLSA